MLGLSGEVGTSVVWKCGLAWRGAPLLEVAKMVGISTYMWMTTTTADSRNGVTECLMLEDLEKSVSANVFTSWYLSVGLITALLRDNLETKPRPSA